MKILLPCLLYRKLSNSKAEQSMQMKRGVSLKSSPANTFSISWISPQTWQAPGEQGRSAFLYTAECLRGAKSWLRKSATGPRSTEFRLWWHKLATCQPAWFLNSVCLILTRVNCPLNEPLWTKKQCILEFHLLFFTWKKRWWDGGSGGTWAHHSWNHLGCENFGNGEVFTALLRSSLGVRNIRVQMQKNPFLSEQWFIGLF